MFSNCDLINRNDLLSFKKLGLKIINQIETPFNVLVMDDFRRRIKVLLALNYKAKLVHSKWI